MKIRNGFVSNSSSSSFTCIVCGGECSGMDMTLRDAEMVECSECGSTMCESHMLDLSDESIRKMLLENENFIDDLTSESNEGADDIRKASSDRLQELYEYWQEFFDREWRYGIHELQCPICALETITDKHLLAYVLRLHNTDKETMENKIRNGFKSLKELKEFSE